VGEPQGALYPVALLRHKRVAETFKEVTGIVVSLQARPEPGRRSKGKRQLERDYKRHVARVIELSDRGFAPSVIAATVDLHEGLIEMILKENVKTRSGG
jgi:hypothetical protein